MVYVLFKLDTHAMMQLMQLLRFDFDSIRLQFDCVRLPFESNTGVGVRMGTRMETFWYRIIQVHLEN